MKQKVLILFGVLLLCLTGCGKRVQDSGLKWDCSTFVPSEDPTYIAYSDA